MKVVNYKITLDYIIHQADYRLKWILIELLMDAKGTNNKS